MANGDNERILDEEHLKSVILNHVALTINLSMNVLKRCKSIKDKLNDNNQDAEVIVKCFQKYLKTIRIAGSNLSLFNKIIRKTARQSRIALDEECEIIVRDRVESVDIGIQTEEVLQNVSSEGDESLNLGDTQWTVHANLEESKDTIIPDKTSSAEQETKISENINLGINEYSVPADYKELFNPDREMASDEETVIFDRPKTPEPNPTITPDNKKTNPDETLSDAMLTITDQDDKSSIKSNEKLIFSDPETMLYEDDSEEFNQLSGRIENQGSETDEPNVRMETEQVAMDTEEEIDDTCTQSLLTVCDVKDASEDEKEEKLKNVEDFESDFSISDDDSLDSISTNLDSDDSFVELAVRKKARKISSSSVESDETKEEQNDKEAFVKLVRLEPEVLSTVNDKKILRKQKTLIVKVERLTPEKIAQLKQQILYQTKNEEEKEFDRLINVKNLKRTRKLSPSSATSSTSSTKSSTSSTSSIVKYPPTKKRRISNESSSSSASESDWSDTSFKSESDSGSSSKESNDCEMDESIDRQWKRLKNEELCESESDIDSDSSHSEESDESRKERQKKIRERRFINLSLKKDRKSSKWRNDRLLRGKLVSDTESDEENKTDVVEKDECDNNINSIKPESSTSDTNKSVTSVTKLRSSVKEDGHFVEVETSSTDSDIEFMENEPATKKTKSTTIDISDSDEDKHKKGRRNIRALMSDVLLDEATKKANKEEEARRSRIIEKQRTMDEFMTQLSQSQDDSIEEEKFVLDLDEDLNPLVVVDPKITAELKEHQKSGVRFMWDACYESVKQLQSNDGSGCILAHCMGLGKTFQVIALIHTLFTHPSTNTKHVLIVCPLSTVSNWKSEFTIRQKGLKRTVRVFDLRKDDRQGSVLNWWRNSGVLVMGYEAYERLTKPNGDADVLTALVDPGPELIVCDEGHLLKNGKTIKTKALMKVKTKRRIMLTGTPLQNNLKEYYYMVQFAKPNLLGTFKEFLNRFVNPIVNGQYHDSTPHDIRKMKKRSHVLHKLLSGTVQRYEVSELTQYLPEKLDYVLFIKLHPVQINLYEEYLTKMQFTKGKVFSNYFALQFVVSHPYILYWKDQKFNQSKKKQKREVDIINLDPDQKEDIAHDWWKEHWSDEYTKNLDYGPKFKVMMAIIDECIRVDDKVLIFSSSLEELDAIEYFLRTVGSGNQRTWRKNHDYYRLDGTVQPEVRSQLCEKFNENKHTRVFLMSHRVGGLGLNLTAANRVIIMSVNWNPVYESQSIFRTYRFGQRKKCFVYRLVAMGTMEEVVYQRSITKLAIACRVVDEHQITRHYKCADLQQMFQLTLDPESQRPTPKPPKDAVLAKLLCTLTDEIFKYHEHQALLENRPDEELNEEEMKLAWEEYNNEKKALEEASRRSNHVAQFPAAFEGIATEWNNLVPMLLNENALNNPTATLQEPTIQEGTQLVLNDIFNSNKAAANNPGPSGAKDTNASTQMVLPKITGVYAAKSFVKNPYSKKTNQTPVIVRTHSLKPTEYVDLENDEVTVDTMDSLRELEARGVQAIPSNANGSNIGNKPSDIYSYVKNMLFPTVNKNIHKSSTAAVQTGVVEDDAQSKFDSSLGYVPENRGNNSAIGAQSFSRRQSSSDMFEERPVFNKRINNLGSNAAKK